MQLLELKMKYKFECYDDLDNSKLTMEFDAIALNEVLNNFKNFLSGVSFVIDPFSHLELVNDENDNN